MPRFLIIWLETINRSARGLYQWHLDLFTSPDEPERARQSRRPANRAYVIAFAFWIVRAVLVTLHVVPVHGLADGLMGSFALIGFVLAVKFHAWADGYAARARERPTPIDITQDVHIDLDALDRRQAP